MHISKNIIGLSLLVAVTACGGGAKTASDVDKAECDAVAAKLQAVDDSMKAEGAGPDKLGPTLAKLSADLKADPIKSPELNTAVAELSKGADALATKIKEMGPTFEAIKNVAAELDVWQNNVQEAAAAYDAACAKGPKDECEKVNNSISQVPRLEGDDFGSYANALEKFLKEQEKTVVKDPEVSARFTNMMKVLGQAIAPMRKMIGLVETAETIDPVSKDVKIKANKVREICGLPKK